ncbi:glutathione S-transferase T3-like isoform X2 [Tripterygium wilfordii]|uniref:glutathione S-transferase T3-like isoform X2 n=1 Tax=Tripterygium wilfordii TaxID=458696 RepID=UPI0018F85055|nr:glutathione S-transferase T3-like isoform X2 [Tripterygium wilfordii]
MMLISAYLNICLDPVIGNQQKLGAYWERIEKYFNENKESENIFRTKGSLQHRWDKIQREVNKFCGHYAKIEGRQQSGYTDQDKIMAAQQMFKSIEGHAFHFLHCWHELRHHPKWLMDQSTKKTKNTKNASPQSSPTLSPNIVNLDEENSVPSTFVGLERPPGRKAEKERIRKGKARDRDNGDSPLASVTMLLKFDEESTKRETRFERAYTQQQELIDIEKMKYTQQRDLIDIEKQKYMQKQEMIDIEKNKEEERIMTTNTTDMPPSLAKYYESRKAEILAKRALSEC